MGMRPIPIENRFWDKINIKSQDECWEWMRSTTTKGYGECRINTHKSIHAHRMAWILTNGEIPEGLLVCHKCDNRKCCNPNHLFLGTNQDNIDDMMKKGRNKFHKMFGTSNPRSKLTDKKVNEIREKYSLGEYTYKDLAKIYGVTFQHIHTIVKYKEWKYVE